MNYFEFFDIPFSLDVDESLLRQKFYANSKKHHPDFFTLEDVEKQMEALEMSTANNNAYKTLISFDKRLHHMLVVKHVLEEEGQNTMPQEFLMDMMEINEAVMELEFDFSESEYEKLMAKIDLLKAALKSEISPIIPKRDEEISPSDYEKLKSYYLKSKYLIRLTENIKKLKP